jgi:hypothetical protein
MARKRKTAAERRQEFDDAKRRAWNAFVPQLEAVTTYTEAMRLVAASPPPGAPGRTYFSNLAFFLQSFAPPAGAGGAEIAQYLRLLQAFESHGALTADAALLLKPPLQKALTERRFG